MVPGRLPGTASMFGITALQRPLARCASELPWTEVISLTWPVREWQKSLDMSVLAREQGVGPGRAGAVSRFERKHFETQLRLQHGVRNRLRETPIHR